MKRLQDVLLALLVVGMAVQIWIATGRIPDGDDRSGLMEPLSVADTVRILTGYTQHGAPVTISLDNETATVTVIYSFHPDCAHSRTWGPEWARHFDEARASNAGVRTILLTLDSPSSGQDFADRLGWEAELLSVHGLSPQQREFSLVSRTPWVFVFDSDGVLRFDGHGSQLGQVEAAVSRLQSGLDQAARQRRLRAGVPVRPTHRYTRDQVRAHRDRRPRTNGAFNPLLNPSERVK